MALSLSLFLQATAGGLCHALVACLLYQFGFDILANVTIATSEIRNGQFFCLIIPLIHICLLNHSTILFIDSTNFRLKIKIGGIHG